MEKPRTLEIRQVSAVAFTRLTRGKHQRKIAVFAASLADITKALAVKKHTDPKTKLPATYYPWLNAFNRKKADALPPFRGPGIDHSIELEKDSNGNELEAPWGPLYSMSREELLVLRKTLTDYIDKCEFSVKSTKYLGFIIEAGKGIRMDPKKVQAIYEWEAPSSVHGVRSFLGFTNFYRRFIKAYSEIVTPLTALTRKESREGDFSLTSQALTAFKKLKKAFTTAPVLAQFHPERETVVETDASGWVTAATLSQYQDDGTLHPCAFYSRKMAPAECNYEIYD